MLSHRAAVFSFALLSICWAASQTHTAYAATVATATAGSISFQGTTAGGVQNNGTISVPVIRTGGTSGAASVLCWTLNNTAVSGRDFTAVDPTLHWASGDATPKNCIVPISDATPFHGSKTFYLRLSSAVGAALGSNTIITVIIYGNLGGGAVSMSAPTYTVAQNAGRAAITVNRTGGSVGSAVVFYATANKTAIAGADYSSTTGGLWWGNGDVTPKTISIPISNAKPFTGTKILAVALAHAENVTLGATTSAIVTIDGDGAGAPTVSLSASPTSVASGGSATLTWSSTNATACTASGGWTGNMVTRGSQSMLDITATDTYRLSCTGLGGSASQSATVTVTPVTTGTGSATLTWVPPTTNANGGPVTPLAGYTVYYGTSAGSLTQSVVVSGATTTSHTVTGLAAGTWYFAVTADAADGAHSAMSNIGSKTI